MIIVRLASGLGNQLGQYAMGRSLAHKLNTELKLDMTYFKGADESLPHGSSQYRLGSFNVQENFATPEEIYSLKKIREKDVSVDEVLNCPNNVYLAGFWQDERYFTDIADIIRKEFTLKKSLGMTAQHWQKKILAAECSVALHIRHGDYLGLEGVVRVLPLEYYRPCVAQLKKFFQNLTVFIFANELNLAKNFLNLDVPAEYVCGEDLTDLEEFYLMSLCRHNVIANSSFSWWAAWLNPNLDKIVFAPSPWFQNSPWRNEQPAGWIKVPVEYGNLLGDEQTFLSIIVHVHNNAANLSWLLAGIAGQRLKDYELILIDDGSFDGSEYICRKISLNKKVTLIASSGGYRQGESLQSRAQLCSRRVRLVFERQRSYFARCREFNLSGLFASTGRYILFRATNGRIPRRRRHL